MRIAFGRCVFDRGRRELVRDGAVVHAGPKLLKLLELLLDTRPRALTKEEIHRALWVDTFVSDATLTSLIAELRAAIGDDARRPQIVKTIHGYGYRFSGDVDEAAPAPAADSGTARCRIAVGDRDIALSPGEHVLGRSDAVSVFVDDAGASRHHARITITNEGAAIEDLGSKNGTVLNGKALDCPTALGDGDVIVLGTTVLKFRVLAPAGSTETLDRRG
ncbi:MAG TPA: FHA domain-containing protein [Vicinamibacterales bacterium]|nr:FHA domain-containing protein [Vicinamibacterales bacterium]